MNLDDQAIDEAAENALIALAVRIQEHIGQDDGGLASQFFSDKKVLNMLKDVARQYLKVESDFLYR